MKRFQELTNPKHKYIWKSSVFREKFWSYDILLGMYLWGGHTVPLCSLLSHCRYSGMWSDYQYLGFKEGVRSPRERVCPLGSAISATHFGDFVYVSPHGTASCFGLHCGAKATSAAVHWFAAGSDYLRRLSSCVKPQQTWFPLFAKCLCLQTMDPVQQFLSSLVLLTEDKNILGFEEAWATLQYNDRVGKFFFGKVRVVCIKQESKFWGYRNTKRKLLWIL